MDCWHLSCDCLIDGLMALVFQPSSVVVPTVSPISVDHQPSRNHQTSLEAVYRPRYSTSSCRSLILGMLHGFLDLHPLCWARTTIVDRRQRQVTSRQDTIFGNQSEKRKHFPFRFLRSVILTVNLGRTPPHLSRSSALFCERVARGRCPLDATIAFASLRFHTTTLSHRSNHW